ncbi:hypothetical protein ACHWQZ_G002586 [Mnemiopsis leidyi]
MLSSPADGRKAYREGSLPVKSTFGCFPGYLQTNVTIVPSDEADNFRKFCLSNPGPCPLLFQSKPGQVSAPTLAENSDIRTDLPAYQEFVDGVPLSESVTDLSHHPWGDFVSFYLGCSFSFDSKLVSCEIELDCAKKGNVAMFITNIPCIPSGPFNCNMVVSMRPIPADLVEKVVGLCVNMDFAHGAPIHIGAPEDIGISYSEPGVLKSDFGGEGEVPPGTVPCFWACGITGNIALRSAKLPLSFNHYAGHMFVADILSEDVPKIVHSAVYPKPMVICTDTLKQRYVSLSENVLSQLNDIESVVTVDHGQRGLEHLLVPEEFTKVCLCLSTRAKTVGILLGFPLFDSEPAEENDGIAGAIYLARALNALDVKVYFLVDESATTLSDCLSACKSKGYVHENNPLIQVGAKTGGLFAEVQFTHLIAIERPSPAADGKYYTMRARDISQNVGPMAEMFRQAERDPEITTIGIGDGGNELGMGKVGESVKNNIPNGWTIAADVTSDYLISCGVSNWGGQAVAAALYALQACPVHSRYRRRAVGAHQPRPLTDFLLGPEQDLELHQWITEMGFRDGCTGERELSVDGLSYQQVHSEILQNLIKVVEI